MEPRAFRYKGKPLSKPLVCHICGERQRSTTIMRNHLGIHERNGTYTRLAEMQSQSLKESNLSKLRNLFK